MKKYLNIHILFSQLILLLAIALSGCEDSVYSSSQNEGAYTSIQLDLLTSGQSMTRAMSEKDESTIDFDQLQILAFEDTGSEEVYRYTALITKRSAPTVTIQVPTSMNGEKYRFVVLANAQAASLVEGTEKNVALNQFVFDCVGKWNAPPANKKNIPMWGELPYSVTIKNDRNFSILLNRALARVDIGLLFKFNNPNPIDSTEYEHADTDKESAWGLDNFKIKNIYVYRSPSKAYVSSTTAMMDQNTPNIPPTNGYNSDDGTSYNTLLEADEHPLIYTLPEAADSYVREIYIPESNDITGQTDMDNVTCFVIGGYYGADNESKVSYYRADIAFYNDKLISKYKPILRNHRYLLDIKSVTSPGFDTPDQALNSISTPLELNVLDWNEVELNYYTQGDYFLRVENRFISMEARAQGGATANTYTISYQTNLDLDGSPGKAFTYNWKIGTYFDVAIDYANKTMTFTALQDNVNSPNPIREDELTVSVENLKFTINIDQKAFKLDYTLLCNTVETHGIYRLGVPLNYTNYISLKVRTNGSDFDGSDYVVQTLQKNGIYFKAEGKFESAKGKPDFNGNYEYDLILEGFGTLTSDAGEKFLKQFTVKIVTNSVDSTTCSASIKPGYGTKRILAIASNTIFRFGYALEPNTASRAFMDASVNFGTDPNSTVIMEQDNQGNAFTIEYMSAESGRGMSGYKISYSYLLNKINTFKPDIILTGHAIDYFPLDEEPNTSVINLLSDYVDQGGVFLMCNEFYPTTESTENMIQKIMGEGVTAQNHWIFGDQQLYTLKGNTDDLLVNGPFGNMKDQIWGADGHAMYGAMGLPAETIIYSTGMSSENKEYVSMFRHATKPFFFMGEGGYIANAQRYIGGAYQGGYLYCPYAIDYNYRPIPRTNYTDKMNKTVHNSQIFANIINWAVDYSDSKGITYENDHKFPLIKK